MLAPAFPFGCVAFNGKQDNTELVNKGRIPSLSKRSRKAVSKVMAVLGLAF
jgi:hypothetical protein